jgi:hypothetical protein
VRLSFALDKHAFGLADMIVGIVWPKSQLGSFGQNAQRLLALMPKSSAARRERRSFHCRTALRSVSKHEGKGIARLILRDGTSRRMRLPKHRRERRTGWSDPCFFLFFCRHRSRVYPRSAPNVRKSGKPDLRGPFQSVAVPDQRCTASRCTASGRRVIDCRIAFPSHQLNQSTLPRSRGAFFCARGLPLCFTHPR